MPTFLLAFAGFGAIASGGVGLVLAQANGAETAAPYLISGTTVASAVGVVVWISRKLVNGELVPRPVKEDMEATRRAAAAAEAMAARLEARDVESIRVGRDTVTALFKSADVLKELAREYEFVRSMVPDAAMPHPDTRPPTA